MATLQRLPKELILEILRYLPLTTVEVVAHTYNHAITDLCMVLLQPLFKSRRVRKRLEKHFSYPPHDKFPNAMMDGLGSESGRKLLNLPPDVPLKWPSRPRRTDHMQLSGDLSWLQPPCDNIMRLMAKHERVPAIYGSAFDDLIASAERIGITIPKSFLKLVQDSELRTYVVKTDRSRVELARGGLRKVPKAMDGGVGGYMIEFLAGLQYRVHLYLEPGEDGGHGILEEYNGYCNYCDMEEESSPEACPNKDRRATKEDEDEAKALGLEMMNYNPCMDFSLLGTDFEEWLVARHFDEWLWFVGMKEWLASPELQEYAQHNLVA